MTAREVSTALTSAADGLSAADWRQVEKNARKAGDTAGAKAVNQYLNSKTTSRIAPHTNGTKTKLVKILPATAGPRSRRRSRRRAAGGGLDRKELEQAGELARRA